MPPRGDSPRCGHMAGSTHTAPDWAGLECAGGGRRIKSDSLRPTDLPSNVPGSERLWREGGNDCGRGVAGVAGWCVCACGDRPRRAGCGRRRSAAPNWSARSGMSNRGAAPVRRTAPGAACPSGDGGLTAPPASQRFAETPAAPHGTKPGIERSAASGASSGAAGWPRPAAEASAVKRGPCSSGSCAR